MEETEEAPALSFDMAFIVLCVITIWSSVKPEFIIPGLSSIGPVRQIPNLMGGALIMLWFVRYPKVLNNPQTKLYLSYFMLIVITTFLARNQGRAIPVAKGFTISTMAFLAFIGVIQQFGQIRLLIKLFVICNILIAFLGIKGGGLVRGIPALEDENDFALLMNILIPFAFFLGLAADKFKNRLFYFGTAGLFTAGVIVSFSRGGFVGLVCVLLYCLSKIKHKAMIIVLAIIIAIPSVFLVSDEYWNEMATLQQGTKEDTASTRIYLWTNAFKIFMHHPIIGVGPENAPIWVTTYDKTERGARDWGRALHSVYFTLLAELGLVGVFLYFAILYYNWKNARQIRGHYLDSQKDTEEEPFEEVVVNDHQRTLKDGYFLSMAIMGGFVGYLSSGVFLSVLYYSWFEKLTMYMIVVYNTISAEIETSGQPSAEDEPIA
jgi:O-antigen ligase